MGKQRGKKRQYVFLYSTCLLASLLFLMNGCAATTLNLKQKWQGRRGLEQARSLVNQGNYRDAIKAYDQVVTIFPDDSPGDTALYFQGVLWAHPDHAQKNYKKALSCFQRLVRDFPRSDLNYQANVMISILNEMTKCHIRSRELEETLNVYKHQLDAFKEIDIGIEEKKRKDLPTE